MENVINNYTLNLIVIIGLITCCEKRIKDLIQYAFIYLTTLFGGIVVFFLIPPDKLRLHVYYILAILIILLYLHDGNFIYSAARAITYYLFIKFYFTLIYILTDLVLFLLSIEFSQFLNERIHLWSNIWWGILFLAAMNWLFPNEKDEDTNSRFSIMILTMLIGCFNVGFSMCLNNTDETFACLFLLGLGESLQLFIWKIFIKKKGEEVKQLHLYIHQTKEILPAIGNALETIKKHSDTESTQIIDELEMLYSEQLQINENDNRNLKSAKSTGIRLLDEKIECCFRECCDNGIDLDVFVERPINGIFHDHDLSEQQFLRLFGDLYRNAFRAVFKNNSSHKHILICLGKKNAYDYEISISDNGLPFPDFVLANLGKRGITTNGTGNGIADIFDVVEQCQASYILNQTPDGTFSKDIMIRFDKKGKITIV